MIDSCKVRFIDEREFIEKLSSIKNKKYIAPLKDIFYNGLKLKEICLKYPIKKRMLQTLIKNTGFDTFMKIRYSGIKLLLDKGYTMESIREKLKYSKRDDLNRLMKEKIRGDISNSKRMRILKKANFRCQLCGADATDRKLHIDHIIPISKGGTSKEDNLQILCSYCNQGKGNS